MATNQPVTPPLDLLKETVRQIGQQYKDRVYQFRKGHDIITQSHSGVECYLIIDGHVNVYAKGDDGKNNYIISRLSNEFIGETVLVQRNSTRTATVRVATDTASLIKFTRNDIIQRVKDQPRLAEAISILHKLMLSRAEETSDVIRGYLTNETTLMSVIMADIHNFSRLSDYVDDIWVDDFLSDFLDGANEIAETYETAVDEQGDGFRIFFKGMHHADNALRCAIRFRDLFRLLRENYVHKTDDFGEAGLGVGVCTDFMTIRKKGSSKRQEGRVFSHAINIAAAISKYRTADNDTGIYIDVGTYGNINRHNFIFDTPRDMRLEKLRDKYTLFPVVDDKITQANRDVTAERLEKEISSHISTQAVSGIDRLAHILAEVIGAPTSREKLYYRSNSDIDQVLQSLIGQQLATGSAVVSFGKEGKFGDVTIRDVAGKDVYNITINFHNNTNNTMSDLQLQ